MYRFASLLLCVGLATGAGIGDLLGGSLGGLGGGSLGGGVDPGDIGGLVDGLVDGLGGGSLGGGVDPGDIGGLVDGLVDGLGGGLGGDMNKPDMGGLGDIFGPNIVPEDYLRSGNITEEFLGEMSAQDFRDIPDDVIRPMLAAFTADKIKKICVMLNKDRDTTLLDRMDRLGLDCSDAIRMLAMEDPDMDLSAALGASMMEKKRDEKPPSDWRAEDWGTALRYYADAVDPKDIMDMAPDALRELVRNKTIDPRDLSRPDQKRAMSEQLRSAFGEAAAWGAAELAELAEGDYLGSVVDPADLRKMEASDMRGALESFARVQFDDKAKKEMVGKKIKEGLGGRESAASWAPRDIASAAQYVLKDKRVLSALPEATLLESLGNFTAQIANKKDGMALGRALKAMTRFSDPKMMDMDRLEELSTCLPAMGKRYLRKLPKAEVMSALDTIGALDFSPGDARAMMEALVGDIDLTSLKKENISMMAGIMSGMKAEHFEQMRPDALEGAIDILGQLDLKPNQARAILKKVRENQNGTDGEKRLGPNAVKMAMLIRYMSASEIEDTTFDDFGMNPSMSSTASIDPTRKQAKMLMKKVKAKFGEMSPGNTNYTSSAMDLWGKMAAMGLSKSDIQNMRIDDELPAMLEYLAESGDDMEEAESMAFFEKLREAYLPDDESFRNATEANMEQVGNFMKHMNDADLDMFPAALKPVIARKIGEASMKRVTMDDMKRLKRFALKNILRDDTSRVTDRTMARTLDDNDMQNLGNLRCGMEKEDIDKMDADAIQNHLFEMGKCAFSKTDGRALFERAKEKISGLLNSSDTLVMAAGVLAYAMDDELDMIPAETWEEALPDVGEAIAERKEKLAERDEAFKGERDDSERDSEDMAIKRALQAGFRATVESTSSRRKRSLGGASCSDISMMGDVTGLNSTDIASLMTSVFDDCAETLGAATGWDMDQLMALKNKAMETWGDVAQWNSSIVEIAGSIMAGLSDMEFGMLPLDQDAMAALGEFDIFTPEKLQAGFEKFLSMNMFTASNLTGDALMTLGSFACGAPASAIMEMDVSAFYDAAAMIGAQTMCGDDQLAAYAVLAQRVGAFGRFSTWDESTVASVGSILGGLPSDKIGMLTEAHISALDPMVVKGLPADKFSAFSAEQIGYFSKSLVSAFTSNQTAMLSEAARIAKGVVVGMGGDMGGGMGGGMGGVTVPSGGMGGNGGMTGGNSGGMGGMIDFDPKSPPEDDLRSGNISGEYLAMMKPQDFRDISDSVLMPMLAAFTSDKTDVICMMVNKGRDTELLGRLSRLGLDCSAAIERLAMSDPNTEISHTLGSSLMEQKRAEKHPTSWGASDWGTALKHYPGAVDPSDIRDMSAAALQELVRNKTINPADLTRPDQKRAMADQLKTAYGEPGAWGASELADMCEGDYLGSIVDPADLRKMGAADMISSLSSFANVQFGDKAKKEMVGKKIKEGLGGRESAGSWGASDIASAAQYVLKDKRVLSSLSESTLIASLGNFTSQISSKGDGMALGRTLKGMSRYSDPSAMDVDRLSEMSTCLPAMGKQYLSRLPPAALVSSLNTLGSLDFSPGDAREMMETLKEQVDLSTLGPANITQMSSLMGGMKASDFASIPASALDGALDTLGDLELQPSQARAVLNMVRSNQNGTGLGSNAAKMGKMIKYVSNSELEDTSFDDFALDCDSTDSFDLEPSKKQAKILAKKIKSQMGEMSASNDNFTSNCMSRWGKVAAMGFTKSDFQSMRTDDELPAMLEYLASYDGDMEESESKAVGDKIRDVLLPDDMSFDNFTETKLEQVGKFLKHMNDTDLDKFPSALKPTVARKLGEASMKRVSMGEMKRLKMFALKNVLRDDTGNVTDRSAAATLDDNDMQNLGNLRCGLEKAEMDKMDADAITNNLFEMGKCAFSQTDGRALFERAMEQLSGLLNSSDTLVMASGLLAYATEAELDTIPADTWEEALPDVGEAITARKEALEKRDEAFTGERSTSQRSSEDAALKSALRAGYNATVAATSSSRRRRRRATSSATCSDISLMSDVTGLSASDIDDLSTSTFDDCAETLGAESAWDSDQLSSLATKAVETWGSVSNWNSTNVANAGSIVAGLSASQIGMLPLDSDAMSSIGAFDIYSSDQLVSGFTQYLSVNSLSASTLTSDDLMTLAAFDCGATESEIGNIAVSAYYDAAGTVGAQSMCDSGQMAAYALLAQDASAYGDVSTWDESTVTSVGSMIGGLTTTQVGTLIETQISSIDPTDMSAIPPAKFAGFSATQIAYFSTSQATSVTADQQEALSSDAQTALVAAGATDLVSDDDSGASAATYSVMLLIAAFFIRM